MEKGKATENTITRSLQNFDFHLNPNIPKSTRNTHYSLRSSILPFEKPKPPSLVGLCLGVVGKHFEDIIEDLGDIAANFPADIKVKLFHPPDIEVSNFMIHLKVQLLSAGLPMFVLSNSLLASDDEFRAMNQSYYCRGCPRSDYTARRCLCLLKPKLDDVEEESWEELDTVEIAHGAPSLRWLVWPKIDKDSMESLSAECPRIVVNPQPSPFGYRGVEVPRGALADVSLDDPIVKDVDPKTWAVSGFAVRATSASSLSTAELPVAEKFRLAFVERDTRLAPKRAKNARQHQRRAEREMVTMSASAKALALASQASRSLQNRNW
ncbi:hypothetical protein RHMOL_Rhmol06G0297800 [Rhododendron molle]|uniref:Uncharacterized protein n=1 Tax=Rhododendron molle TaxID=49168 RepID=A0ACC0NJ39_RHOML|nr:hypothetical protein RHMOL_Rhmol06G0297800 [Rhododendron molle]